LGLLSAVADGDDDHAGEEGQRGRAEHPQDGGPAPAIDVFIANVLARQRESPTGVSPESSAAVELVSDEASVVIDCCTEAVIVVHAVVPCCEEIDEQGNLDEGAEDPGDHKADEQLVFHQRNCHWSVFS
jgi:hypothetical protein